MYYFMLWQTQILLHKLRLVLDCQGNMVVVPYYLDVPFWWW